MTAPAPEKVNVEEFPVSSRVPVITRGVPVPDKVQFWPMAFKVCVEPIVKTEATVMPPDPVTAPARVYTRATVIVGDKVTL